MRENSALIADKNIQYCMKYDTCKRCPRNKECEREYRKDEKARKANAVKKVGE